MVLERDNGNIIPREIGYARSAITEIGDYIQEVGAEIFSNAQFRQYLQDLHTKFGADAAAVTHEYVRELRKAYDEDKKAYDEGRKPRQFDFKAFAKERIGQINMRPEDVRDPAVQNAQTLIATQTVATDYHLTDVEKKKAVLTLSTLMEQSTTVPEDMKPLANELAKLRESIQPYSDNAQLVHSDFFKKLEANIGHDATVLLSAFAEEMTKGKTAQEVLKDSNAAEKNAQNFLDLERNHILNRTVPATPAAAKRPVNSR